MVMVLEQAFFIFTIVGIIWEWMVQCRLKFEGQMQMEVYRVKSFSTLSHVPIKLDMDVDSFPY